MKSDKDFNKELISMVEKGKANFEIPSGFIDKMTGVKSNPAPPTPSDSYSKGNSFFRK